MIPLLVVSMTYLRYVSALDGGPKLSALYEKYSDKDGQLDHILKIHSLNPLSMEHHMMLYVHLMRGRSPLTRIQREMIAVVVSSENDCYY